MFTSTIIAVLFLLPLIDEVLDPVGNKAAPDTRREGSAALAW